MSTLCRRIFSSYTLLYCHSRYSPILACRRLQGIVLAWVARFLMAIYTILYIICVLYRYIDIRCISISIAAFLFFAVSQASISVMMPFYNMPRIYKIRAELMVKECQNKKKPLYQALFICSCSLLRMTCNHSCTKRLQTSFFNFFCS